MAPLIGFQETFASFGTESAEPKFLHGSCKVLNWTNYPIRGKDSCEDKEVDPAYRALVDHTELVDHVNQMCGQEQKFLQEFNEKICDTDSSQDQHQVFQIPAIRDTIGYQLLIRQGWKSGCGLGKHLQGPTEAIQIEQKHEQLGLGRLQMEIERIGATTEHRRLLACERPVSQELEQENRQREQLRTDSLAQMKAAFHCDLCDLQYASYVQWDNHINSYGHAHKQRLKELQQKETHRKLSSRRCKKKEKREQIGQKEPMHQNSHRVPLTTKDCNTFQHWIIRQVQQTKPTCLKQRQIRFHLLRRLKAGGGPHSAFHQPDPNCDMGHADIGKDSKMKKDGLWQKVPRCPRAVYYHMKPQVSSVKPSVPFLTFVRDCGEKFLGKPCDSVEENSSGQPTDQGSKEQDSHPQSDGSSKQGDKDTNEKPSGDPQDDNSGTNKDNGKAGDGDNGNNADEGISNDSNKVSNDTSEAKPGDNGACQTVGGGDAANTDIDPGGTNAENANLEDIQLPPLPPPPNIPEGKGKMLTFVKVRSKDENRDLDWPAEMIQYTVSEPKITYSCNPLFVDLSALLLGRKPKLMDATLAEKPENEEASSDKLPVKEDIYQVETEAPVPHTKSSKKKKKKKHRKGKKRKKDSKVKEEANPPNIPENVTETKTETKTMAVESATTETENLGLVKQNEPTEATAEVEEKKKSTKKQKLKKKKKRKSRKAKKRKHVDDNEQAGDGAKEVPARKKKRKKKDKAKKLKKEAGTGDTPVTVKSADDTGGKDTKNTPRKDHKKSGEKKQKSQRVSKKKKQEKDETQAQTKAEKTPSKTPNKIGTPGKVGTPIAPVKKEGDVLQKPGDSRKRNASESSTGDPGKAKKIKKTISLGKLPQRTNLANISNPLQEFETDFDTTDGKKVPKWDTSSDSEIDEGKANTPSKNPIVAATSTGFGKIGPKHKMQFPAAGGDSQHSQGSNLSAQGKLGEAVSQNLVNSRTHHKSSGHSSHRSRSYSRSRSRRDWSYSSDSNHGRRSRYSDYSDSDYSRRGYSSDRYSRSRSRSYSRERYGSSSRRSYSSYSSRSRSRSYSRGYSRSSSRSYSRGRHRRRSYSRSSYTSSSYSRSRSRGRSRSRSSSYDRRSSRSRSGSSSHSMSKKREMRESPDEKYSTVLPKRDPKPSRKSEKPSEQKTFSLDELVTPVSIKKGEVAEQAQKLLDKVKDKKSDGDPKVVAGTTLVQNENGALVGFIGKRQGAKKKEELCIPLPPGASPAGNKKGDSFIGPTLPPDHPLAPLQDIPIPRTGSALDKQSKKPDLSKVPLPPPVRPPVFFNPSVPPPPPPSGMTGPRMQNTQLPPLPSKSPPPLPEAEVKEPPKEEKKEEEPGAMIPPAMDPEEADMYKKLQKEAARHARRKIREEEGGSTDSESEEEEGVEEAQPELEEEPETIMVAEPVPIASPMTPIAHMALTPQPVPHLISGAGLAAAVGTPTPTLQPVHVPLSQPHLVPVMISQQGLVFSANPGIPVQAVQPNPGLIQVQAPQPIMVAHSSPSGVMLAAAAQAHASQLAAATQVVPAALQHQFHPALTGGLTGLQTAALAGQAVPIQAAAAAAAHLSQAHSMIQPVAVQHPSGGTIVVGRQVFVPRLRHPHL